MLAPYVQLLGLEHAVHRFGAVAHPIVNAKRGFCTSDVAKLPGGNNFLSPRFQVRFEAPGLSLTEAPRPYVCLFGTCPGH